MDEKTLERQCDPEYIAQVKDLVGQYDAVISMACGVGPQFLSEAYPDQRFFPAVNTTSFGGAVRPRGLVGTMRRVRHLPDPSL